MERLGVLLVRAKRGIKIDVGHLEKVELHLGVEVSLVANDAVVMVLQFHNVQIVDVVDVGHRNVVRVEHTAYACKAMELVAIIILPLGGAVAIGRSTADVVPAHGTTHGLGVFAHLYGLRINNKLLKINGMYNIFINLFSLNY